MRKIVIVVVVVALASVAAFVLRPRAGDPRVEGGVVEMETPLPDLSAIETVSGEALPQDAFGGAATVINVWATWCDPCLREQPALVRVQADYADRGVAFLGINYNDDRLLARQWIDDHDVSYPSLYDPSGRAAALLGFPFLPDTYVVDSGGTIRYGIYGETDEAELSGLIDDVLAGGESATG